MSVDFSTLKTENKELIKQINYRTNCLAKIEFKEPDDYTKSQYIFFKENKDANPTLLHGHENCSKILDTNSMQEPSYLKQQIINLTNCISRMEMILPNNEGEKYLLQSQISADKALLNIFSQTFSKKAAKKWY